MSASKPLRVLLLGVHMNPGEPITEEQLIKLIDEDADKGRAEGLDIQHQLIHLADPEYETVAKRLREQTWDIVAIGGGVRFPKDRTFLFEWLVNAVVKFAKPTPTLVFNTTPDGVMDACLRVKPQIEQIAELEQKLSSGQ